jgi:L-aspartate semialdehyde sulfurtransferase ferredoxin
MIETIWQPQLDEAVCDGCGDCIIHCPTGALALVDDTAVLVNPEACIYCADCESICPVGAISLPYQIVLEHQP